MKKIISVLLLLGLNDSLVGCEKSASVNAEAVKRSNLDKRLYHSLVQIVFGHTRDEILKAAEISAARSLAKDVFNKLLTYVLKC